MGLVNHVWHTQLKWHWTMSVTSISSDITSARLLSRCMVLRKKKKFKRYFIDVKLRMYVVHLKVCNGLNLRAKLWHALPQYRVVVSPSGPPSSPLPCWQPVGNRPTVLQWNLLHINTPWYSNCLYAWALRQWSKIASEVVLVACWVRGQYIM